MALEDPGTIEEGDPAVIRAEADELKTVAANIHTVVNLLRTVSTKGVWDSCSGTMFEREVGTTPSDLVAIANRLSGAERIIRPYADRLEESQATLKRLRGRYDTNTATAQARKERLATMTPEDPEYVAVEREYRAAANSREMNRRGFAREADAAAADEHAVAASLSVVGSDLSDERLYNTFEQSSRVGTSSLATNPVSGFVKPMGVLAAGDPIGRFGRRAVYGEGSYSDVGKSTYLAAVDTMIPLSRQIKTGRRIKAADRAAELRSIRAADKSTNPIAHRRIGADAKSWAKHKAATSKVRGRHKATDWARETSGINLADDFATDWAAVAGSGHVRKGGVIVTYGVRKTNHTVSRVESGISTGQSIDAAADKVTESPSERQERQEREAAAERREEAQRSRRAGAIDDLTGSPLVSPVP